MDTEAGVQIKRKQKERNNTIRELQKKKKTGIERKIVSCAQQTKESSIIDFVLGLTRFRRGLQSRIVHTEASRYLVNKLEKK